MLDDIAIESERFLDLEDARRRIKELEATLRRVVNHWREFGEMIVLDNATNRDDYGFDERVEDAAKIIGM